MMHSPHRGKMRPKSAPTAARKSHSSLAVRHKTEQVTSLVKLTKELQGDNVVRPKSSSDYIRESRIKQENQKRSLFESLEAEFNIMLQSLFDNLTEANKLSKAKLTDPSNNCCCHYKVFAKSESDAYFWIAAKKYVDGRMLAENLSRYKPDALDESYFAQLAQANRLMHDIKAMMHHHSGTDSSSIVKKVANAQVIEFSSYDNVSSDNGLVQLIHCADSSFNVGTASGTEKVDESNSQSRSNSSTTSVQDGVPPVGRIMHQERFYKNVLRPMRKQTSGAKAQQPAEQAIQDKSSAVRLPGHEGSGSILTAEDIGRSGDIRDYQNALLQRSTACVHALEDQISEIERRGWNIK